MGKLQLVRGFAGICTDAALPLYSAASVLSRGLVKKMCNKTNFFKIAVRSGAKFGTPSGKSLEKVFRYPTKRPRQEKR